MANVLQVLLVEAVASQAKMHTDRAGKRLHPKPGGNTEASAAHKPLSVKTVQPGAGKQPAMYRSAWQCAKTMLLRGVASGYKWSYNKGPIFSSQNHH